MANGRPLTGPAVPRRTQRIGGAVAVTMVSLPVTTGNQTPGNPRASAG